MFTSPVPEDASIILIGTNPRGGVPEGEDVHPRMQRFESGNFGVPESHDYAVGGREYPVAEAVRSIFAGAEDLLEDSIETNRYYLRTRDTEGHDDLRSTVSGDIWDEYIQFCEDTDQGLIEHVDPDLIFAFSLGAFYEIRSDDRYESEYIGDSERPNADTRLFAEAKINGYPLVGTHHLSYTGEEDQAEIRELLEPYLDAVTG